MEVVLPNNNLCLCIFFDFDGYGCCRNHRLRAQIYNQSFLEINYQICIATDLARIDKKFSPLKYLFYYESYL